jgi:hypothetical protein
LENLNYGEKKGAKNEFTDVKECANWKLTNRNMAYHEANIEALEEFRMPDL